MASRIRSLQAALCVPPGRGLPTAPMCLHCGHPSMYPWSVRSFALILKFLGAVGGAVAARPSIASVGASNLTAGSTLSLVDQGVILMLASFSLDRLLWAGRRVTDRASTLLPSSVART